MQKFNQEEINSELDRQSDLYIQKTTNSFATLKSGAHFMPLGVASSFQSHYPYPFVIKEGKGHWITDIDQNRYLDLHGGFGAGIMGHGDRDIKTALQLAASKGTHFGAPHSELNQYVKLLCERFRLQKVRLSTSGTEATMDAIRFARAWSKKKIVVKIEGSYHGHHDVALVSTKPDLEAAKWPPKAVKASEGILDEVVKNIKIVPANNIRILEKVFQTYGEQIACFIFEPIMCNLGFTRLQKDFLTKARDLCNQYKSVLIWDEVKTGATISYGGAADFFPEAKPDLVCLGKAIGGGMPIGAVGGREDIMAVIGNHSTPHYGTFSGNPMAIAAGTVALQKLEAAEYTAIETKTKKLVERINKDIENYSLPLHTDYQGFKGGIFYSPQKITNYREWVKETDTLLSQLGWLYSVNQGVWSAPGADEQWTLKLNFDTECSERFIYNWEKWVEILQNLREKQSF